MKRAQTYEFAEGTMTIREFIEKHVPCLPESTVRLHIKHGRLSAHAMLTYNGSSTAAKAGAKGRATQRTLGMHARYGSKPGRFR